MCLFHRVEEPKSELIKPFVSEQQCPPVFTCIVFACFCKRICMAIQQRSNWLKLQMTVIFDPCLRQILISLHFGLKSISWNCHKSTECPSSISNHLRGAFNNIQDFFVQVFKIVKDSLKFTMLFLYILWDDWPIFMISRSNEQLQQQLEYTLLKPDCHSWWISKMQSGR